ncbi:MAG: hypothetical protein Q9195_001944 [Heterodermia aff. obscurata]
MANHVTTRTREKPTGDEEAAQQLKLGEFANVPTLTLSEARLLINAVMSHRKNPPSNKEGDVFNKTTDYLDIFARFKAKENIEAVEQMLDTRTELVYFERSQLGSLCCETAEEAKLLIPSLHAKITDDDLQDLLDNIMRLRVSE